MDILAHSPLLTFALKMAVMPVSALAIWVNFRWLKQKFARQPLLPGMAEALPQEEPKRPPPGEVAQLIVLSMTGNPWKWRLLDDGWLVWSRSPDQRGEVELHFDQTAQTVRADGLMGQTIEFGPADQDWLFEAINGLKAAIKERHPVKLPPGLGEVAGEIITSIKLKPDCWHQIEQNWFLYSPKPITKTWKADAKIWVGNGKSSINLQADSKEGTLDIEFTPAEKGHIWDAYQEWRQQHMAAMVDREIALTKAILSGKDDR